MQRWVKEKERGLPRKQGKIFLWLFLSVNGCEIIHFFLKQLNFIKKAQYVRFLLKYPKTTRTVLYILLTCVLALSQMFQMFKSREISNFN